MSPAEEVNLWAMSDLSTPWAIHVVATLGIADHIAAGITAIDDLAAAAHCHAESLQRVLRHLVGRGVFMEPSLGQFTLNGPARLMLSPMFKLGFDLEGFGGRMAYAWGGLLESVRTGEPAYRTIFGRPFWDDLAVHPKLAADFDALMGPSGHGLPDPDVLIGGWESVRTVVDVGGGTGALLAEVLRAHPEARGTLVDVPATVARSAEIFQAAGVADRVTTIGQSFFDPLPAGGDLYLLKSVLSDWADPKASAILRRCADAARPNGRVVIVNGVSPDDARPPAPELLMMVLVGGKQRTLSEFRDLARGAGLEVHAAERKPSGKFIVECRTLG